MARDDKKEMTIWRRLNIEKIAEFVCVGGIYEKNLLLFMNKKSANHDFFIQSLLRDWEAYDIGALHTVLSTSYFFIKNENRADRNTM